MVAIKLEMVTSDFNRFNSLELWLLFQKVGGQSK